MQQLKTGNNGNKEYFGERIEYHRFKRMQYKRMKLLLDKKIFNIKNGYVYVLDKIGNGYSQYGITGNAWSKKQNVYYYVDDSEFKHENAESRMLKDDEIKFDNSWYLFKRAIEEWDLMQISKYYDIFIVNGPAGYLASRIEMKDNTIVNVETFIWYDNGWYD